MNWTDAQAVINSGQYVRRTTAWDATRKIGIVDEALKMIVAGTAGRPGMDVQWAPSQPDQDATDWEIQ